MAVPAKYAQILEQLRKRKQEPESGGVPEKFRRAIAQATAPQLKKGYEPARGAKEAIAEVGKGVARGVGLGAARLLEGIATLASLSPTSLLHWIYEPGTIERKTYEALSPVEIKTSTGAKAQEISSVAAEYLATEIPLLRAASWAEKAAGPLARGVSKILGPVEEMLPISAATTLGPTVATAIKGERPTPLEEIESVVGPSLLASALRKPATFARAARESAELLPESAKPPSAPQKPSVGLTEPIPPSPPSGARPKAEPPAPEAPPTAQIEEIVPPREPEVKPPPEPTIEEPPAPRPPAIEEAIPEPEPIPPPKQEPVQVPEPEPTKPPEPELPPPPKPEPVKPPEPQQKTVIQYDKFPPVPPNTDINNLEIVAKDGRKVIPIYTKIVNNSELAPGILSSSNLPSAKLARVVFEDPELDKISPYIEVPDYKDASFLRLIENRAVERIAETSAYSRVLQSDLAQAMKSGDLERVEALRKQIYEFGKRILSYHAIIEQTKLAQRFGQAFEQARNDIAKLFALENEIGQIPGYETIPDPTKVVNRIYAKYFGKQRISKEILERAVEYAQKNPNVPNSGIALFIELSTDDALRKTLDNLHVKLLYRSWPTPETHEDFASNFNKFLKNYDLEALVGALNVSKQALVADEFGDRLKDGSLAIVSSVEEYLQRRELTRKDKINIPIASIRKWFREVSDKILDFDDGISNGIFWIRKGEFDDSIRELFAGKQVTKAKTESSKIWGPYKIIEPTEELYAVSSDGKYVVYDHDDGVTIVSAPSVFTIKRYLKDKKVKPFIAIGGRGTPAKELLLFAKKKPESFDDVVALTATVRRGAIKAKDTHALQEVNEIIARISRAVKEEKKFQHQRPLEEIKVESSLQPAVEAGKPPSPQGELEQIRDIARKLDKLIEVQNLAENLIKGINWASDDPVEQALFKAWQRFKDEKTKRSYALFLNALGDYLQRRTPLRLRHYTSSLAGPIEAMTPDEFVALRRFQKAQDYDLKPTNVSDLFDQAYTSSQSIFADDFAIKKSEFNRKALGGRKLIKGKDEYAGLNRLDEWIKKGVEPLGELVGYYKDRASVFGVFEHPSGFVAIEKKYLDLLDQALKTKDYKLFIRFDPLEREAFKHILVAKETKDGLQPIGFIANSPYGAFKPGVFENLGREIQKLAEKIDEGKLAFRGETAGRARQGGGRLQIPTKEVIRGAARPMRPDESVLEHVDSLFKPPKPGEIPQINDKPATNWISELRKNFIDRYEALNELERKVLETYRMPQPKLKLGERVGLIHGAYGKAQAEIIRYSRDVEAPIRDLRKEFNEYLFLRRMHNRMRNLQEKGERYNFIVKGIQWDMDTVERGLQELEKKVGPDGMRRLQEAAAKHSLYMRRVLLRELQSGRISKEDFKAIDALNDFYAPLHVLEYLNAVESGIGVSKVSTRRRLMHYIRGLETLGHVQFRDMVEASKDIIQKSVILAEKNRKMQLIANLAKIDAMGAFVRRIRTDSFINLIDNTAEKVLKLIEQSNEKLFRGHHPFPLEVNLTQIGKVIEHAESLGLKVKSWKLPEGRLGETLWGAVEHPDPSKRLIKIAHWAATILEHEFVHAIDIERGQRLSLKALTDHPEFGAEFDKVIRHMFGKKFNPEYHRDPAERLAFFVEYWLQDPESAKKLAPNFTEFFENTMLSIPRFGEAVRKMAEIYEKVGNLKTVFSKFKEFSDLSYVELALNHIFPTKVLARGILKGETPRPGRDVVFYREKGAIRALEVSEDIADILNGLGSQETNLVANMVRGVTQLAKAGMTGYNVYFQVRNILGADLPRVATVSRFGVKGIREIPNFLADVAVSFMTALRGNFAKPENIPKEYLEFLESGAAGATMQRNITPGILAGDVKGMLREVASWLPKLANTVEETSKIVGFRRGMRFTKELQEAATPQQLQRLLEELVLEVRNYAGSPDFQRHGTLFHSRNLNGLNLLFMFANARVQGVERDLMRLISGEKLSTREKIALYGRVTKFMVLPSLALVAWNHSPENRDDYERLHEKTRENSFIVMLPGYTVNDRGEQVRNHVRFPKREAWKMVANFVESLYRYLQDTDPENLQRWATQFINDIMPVSISGRDWQERVESVFSSFNPVIAAPLELATNRDFYYHRPIEPEYISGVRRESLPDIERYDEKTAKWAVATAKLLGKAGFDVSPMMVEHGARRFGVSNVINQLTGGGSRYLPEWAKKPIIGSFVAPFAPVYATQPPLEEYEAIRGALTEQGIREARLSRRAKEILEDIRKNPANARKYEQELRSNPFLLEEVRRGWEKFQQGWSPTASMIRQLQVSTGDRAKFIFNRVKQMPREEAIKWINELERQGLLSSQVKKQIISIATNQ